MEKINIGKSDLKVAPVNLGGNVFGWTLNEQQSFELIKEGTVRYIAASNISQERLLRSLVLGESGSYPLYQALQPHYNLMERNGYESAYAPIAQQYGLSVFPYYALASGFLTGKYRSAADSTKSVRGEGAGKYLNEKGLQVLQALDQVARKHSSQVATVALAWLLAQPNIAAPVVSATSINQLETLFAAPELKLDAGDVEKLNNASL
ncbi:MAG: putative oxidoreductase, aryl-alcohol dehydrogenase like protein [Ferruginibacter sp.]|nr:putative oxidoreductase, aryl-alcohol dehydrogenase like protein [Ferruginibacter sp.]